MRFGSVCSGIEAASCAWEPLGWKAQFVSEIEPFPSAVLAHHYPDVPNVGDMTKYKEWNLERTIDVLVGGTPCQSFSVAGLRKGLADPRGNLALVYCGLLDHFRPNWFVWENVPGVLSSNGGRDFGSFLGALVGLGYGFAYRVLDAQYFGVAQRRRRVFVVGYLGDWRPASEVLFESESLRGHPAPRRQAGKATTGTVTTRAGISSAGGLGTDEACDGFVQPVAARMVAFGEYVDDGTASAMKARDYKDATDLVAQPIAFHPTQDPIHSSDGSTHALGCGSKNGNSSFAVAIRTANTSANGHGVSAECAHTLDRAQGQAVMSSMAVRRLTPRECERLQGFPDDYTLIPWRGKDAAECPDGPRYKALGNSMAVPVMRWIGERIQMVEQSREVRDAA